MDKSTAIKLAGGHQALARLLGITTSAVSQWDEEVPPPRVWQLKVLRPQWFDTKPPEGAGAATQEPSHA